MAPVFEECVNDSKIESIEEKSMADHYGGRYNNKALILTGGRERCVKAKRERFLEKGLRTTVSATCQILRVL